jgi:AraC-like DNA-binding protein
VWKKADSDPAEVDRRVLPMLEAGEMRVPFIVRGLYEKLESWTEWDEHSHPTHELLWVDAGAGAVVVGARTWMLTPRVAMWIPAGLPHRGWAGRGVLHRAAQFRIEDSPNLGTQAVSVEMNDLLRSLLDRVTHAELSDEGRARSEAVIFDLLVPSSSDLVLVTPTSSLLAPIVEAVRADPADARTLGEWATSLGVSSRTITRGFSRETGMNFSQWTAVVRTQHAMMLLSEGETTMAAAHLAGYADAAALTRAFRRVTGMTPAEFRRG